MATKSTAELLSEYNIIREAKGNKPLKGWKGGHAKLVELVAKEGVRVSKGAPAVANGAYRTEREARHKTGIGKANGQPSAKTPAPAPATPSRSSDDGRARNVEDGEIHLSEIAASIDITPRAARIKARAHKTKIRNLEVKGKKYVFPIKAKSQVIDILRTKHSGE